VAATRAYRFAGLELDPHQGCFRRDGQEHYPRAKVLQVLVYLVERRERLVTKEELIDQVWKRTAVTEDAVFHCITEIRTLLGDSREHPRFIRTVPGTGYRFIVPVEEVSARRTDGRPFSRYLTWAGVAAGLVLVLALAWLGWRHWQGRASTPDSEVAWWRFGEGSGRAVRDFSGQGNEGALEGAAVRTAGIIGNAVQLDGIGANVVGRDTGRSLPRGSDPRTLSAWIRSSNANGDTTCVFNYGGRHPRSFMIGLDSRGQGIGGTAFENVRSQVRLDNGVWHFLAVTYGGPATNLIRLYVDGAAEGERKTGTPVDTGSDSAWRIGRAIEAGTPFRGAIGDVRVYRRALSAAQVAALYRCTSRQPDLTLAGGQALYYLPAFSDGVLQVGPEREVLNPGYGLAGLQLAQSDGVCRLNSLRGASLGDNLYMAMDLLVPAAAGQLVTAGPYFRSRAAAPGDGIIGGTSAGYWVQLDSDGRVRVRCLNPHRVVAFTPVPAVFDGIHFHRLETLVRGTSLQVKLDGVPLEFDQEGRPVNVVSIPAAWVGPPKTGTNQGTAGIAFSSEPRESGGHQQARNIVVIRDAAQFPESR